MRVAEGGEVLVLGLPGADRSGDCRVLGLSHRVGYLSEGVFTCGMVLEPEVRGMCVVQTPSPWAIVASLCT